MDPSSAVAAFSEVISSHISRPSAGFRGQDRPSFNLRGANALPTELLLVISDLVFQLVTNPNIPSRPELVTWEGEDLLSPCLLPYSLASVCVRWMGILWTISHYWTRVIIAVDFIATSLRAIRSVLDWSGEYLLDLTVTRHPHTFEEVDTNEHSRIEGVLDLIRPHVRRAHSLAFNVRHSTSIPWIWEEQGCAQHLRVLKLASNGPSPAIIATTITDDDGITELGSNEQEDSDEEGEDTGGYT